MSTSIGSTVIRFPRPADGGVIYTPQEAANIGYNIDNNANLSWTDKKLHKEAIVAKGIVPCQYTRLNQLIKDHGGPGKPAAKSSWNMKGSEEITDIDELSKLVSPRY